MILYGASGHAKVIIDILEAIGKKIDYLVDDNASVPYLLNYEVKRDCGHYDSAIVSIGNGRIRKEIVSRLDVKEWVKAIRPKAIVSPHTYIDEGTVVMAGTVINSGAEIGKHCIINTGATVDHDCVIEDYCHIAPGVHIKGGVNIGEGSWIGVGTCIKQGVKIGKWVTIGAGSVVLKDIPDGVTAFGCPCRVTDTHNNNLINKELHLIGEGKRIAFTIVKNEERRMNYAA